MKSRGTGLAASALLALAVSSCGGLISDEDESSSDGNLTYWSMWSEGEPQQVVLAEAIAEFTKDTGIEVDVQWVGRDNIKKLSPTLNEPTTPVDLVDGAQRNLKSVLVTTGSHLPLGDVFDTEIPGEDGVVVRDVIPERYVENITEDGEPWMVPYELVTSAFWYNAGEYPELAEEPPKTWDALMTFLDEAKSNGQAPLALDGDIANFNLYYFAELAVRGLGPGGLHEAVADQTGEKLRAPAIRTAAEKVQELVDGDYFAAGYASSKWPALQRKWAQNEAALIFNGTWIASESAEYTAPDFDLRAFAMPAADDMPQSQEVSFIGFGVPSKAAHTDEAAQFITYFMNKERLAGISTQALNLTPRPDIDAPEQLSDAKQLIEEAPAVHGQFDHIEDDYGDWTNKVLIPRVNDLVFGKIDAQAFADQLPEQSAEYWKNNG